MKASRLLWTLPLLGLAISGSAFADRGGHDHFGVGILVGPAYGPWYYPRGYYPPYYPPPVIVAPPPPVYLEQQQVAPAPAAAASPMASAPANAWYYCAAANGYYPYVAQCPGGWQAVSPQPPR